MFFESPIYMYFFHLFIISFCKLILLILFKKTDNKNFIIPIAYSLSSFCPGASTSD